MLRMNLLWPLWVFAPGLLLLAVTLRGGAATSALAIPAMLLTGTGGLLFIQNLTGYWESWSYAWTLYGVFLGMGFVLMGQLGRSRMIEQLGNALISFGLMAFAGVGVFFELIIGVGGSASSGLWAGLLIGLGVWMLMRSRPGRAHPPSGGGVIYGSSGKRYDVSRLSTPDTERDRRE
jgi:hypothetical protein